MAQVVHSSPASASATMYRLFLFAISSARRRVRITNPYFMPDAQMRDAMIQARQRGVQVALLLPGEIDHEVVEEASRAGFARLLDAGVEIAEYQAGLLHAKTMTVDGVWGTVGSANLDNRSLALNYEVDLVVYDREQVGRLDHIFDEDLAHSRPIDRRQWQQRSAWHRFLEWLTLPVKSEL
jgi:cardiolipin synthase